MLTDLGDRKAVPMLVKDDDEKCCRKTFTNMQVLQRRDVGEKYVDEILC